MKKLTAEAKRLWMQQVRRDQRLSVTDFANELKWDRSDTSAMLNGTAGRGITDDRIDEVVRKFKVQPPVAQTSMMRSATSGRFNDPSQSPTIDPGDFIPKVDERTLAMAVLNLQQSVKDALDFIKEQGEMIRELHSELISKKRKA